ncbi:MAG: hypothetical protein ACOYN3_00965 [Acidimicrobiia bacterium]
MTKFPTVPLLDRIYELRDEIHDGNHTPTTAAYELFVEGYPVTIDRARELLLRDLTELEANHVAVLWAAEQEYASAVARTVLTSEAPVLGPLHRN